MLSLFYSTTYLGPGPFLKTRAHRSHWNKSGDHSLPLLVGGWGQEAECNLESPPKEAASPRSPPRPNCHNHPQTHIPALQKKQKHKHIEK